MKTIFTLSLLPVIVLAYYFSAEFYVAGNYFAAYPLIAIFFGSVVYFIYRAGSQLERSRVEIV